jgi:inosine-uridine nucleoside N-ribohydrolase
MLPSHRLAPLLLAALLPISQEALAETRAPAPARRIPIILDTDIGDDIDDTWALVLLLKSPEVDLRLVVTDYGDSEYQAKIVARLLEIAGRTDVPVARGLTEGHTDKAQEEWVKAYDLAKYPGRVRPDGVQALIDTVMASPEPTTLVAIGPCPNLRAALEREPGIAARLRLTGMYGSLRVGYGGKPGAEPEWNVRANPAAARTLLAAPWVEATVTPLDTCGRVQLKGARYARVREAQDPLARALMENYRLWCPRKDWCVGDAEYVTVKSSTLFDTVAVYLALSRDLVRTESIGVRVTDEGMTVPDPAGRPLAWATGWRSLDRFEEWLAARLTAPPP